MINKQDDFNHVLFCYASYIRHLVKGIFTRNHYTMMIDIDVLLAWGATFKKVCAGEIIFREGTQPNFYYQLISGKVRWVNIKEDGKEYIQDIVEPNECFGEFSLFDREPFAATAIANEDSVIVRLHAETFHQLLKEYPELNNEFLKLLTQRLRFKFLIANELSCGNPEHRISVLLGYLKQNEKTFCKKCSQVKLTRKEIADMTGLRVETVIRSIKHLHNKGWLHINKGKVYC